MTDMSAIEQRAEPTLAAVSGAEVADFVALMKPRVMSLVVFTALVGLLVAPGHLHPVLGFAALLCIAVGAGAAGALNMWYDADIDAVMTRTARRPIPAGRMLPGEALGFGLTLSIGAVLMLGLMANWVAAGLLAFTIFFYVAVYTVWLKRSTPQNIVIGGAAGAVPPLVGYASASGHLGWAALVMFGIVFLWTPPHFWALALMLREHYANAAVPMLPVVAGERETARQIAWYTLALVAATLVPVAFGVFGLLYGGVALVLGAVLLWWSVDLLRDTSRVRAVRLFHYSLAYLALLFVAMALDVAV